MLSNTLSRATGASALTFSANFTDTVGIVTGKQIGRAHV